MDYLRLENQIQFIKEIDQVKNIFRKNIVSKSLRCENDAEHSWHMSIMAFLLMEHLEVEDIDILKVIKMCLIHDLVEIDAGDTYCYDNEGKKTKQQREIQAADRIFNILPLDQAEELRKLWDEFEEGDTVEAKYAALLDRLQPLIMHTITDGKVWKENNIKREQVLQRNKNRKNISRVIGEKIEEIINESYKKQWLK